MAVPLFVEAALQWVHAGHGFHTRFTAGLMKNGNSCG
jgi:hypothetical protein